MDPIDIAWGPDGKAWVVEMADYPLGFSPDGHLGLPDPPNIPCGRVRYLEDTNGDGRYDKSTLFLDKISYPNGVMPWRKGVIVTAAPEVFYAEDTDGDGKADLRRTLFAGFGEGNQQHRTNYPRWGLDNWVYLANGDSNGKIRSAKTGQVVDISGRDLRIKPDAGLIDPQTGHTQHGRDRDDWGNWFGCSNSIPGWHFALADHYLRRNPHVTAPPATIHLTPDRDSFPIGRVITHCFYDQPTPQEGQPGIWTCLCGTMLYRDELFGPNYLGNLFLSDGVYNVIHRSIVRGEGSSFRSERAPDEQLSEFLASADPWFRPATCRTGPDGALWICDMYRVVIEHPEWINDDLEKTLDLRKGHHLGRIYRVSPVGKEPRAIPRLDRLDTAGLVAALDSPSGWQRDMAQQMLLWRADNSAVGPLRKMALESPRALARLHALCTLDGLGALNREVLLRGLADSHPGVRRHTVRLCEPFVESDAALGPAMLELVDDPDAQVRMQLAYSLGAWRDQRAARALGRMAVRATDDPYLTAAVMSSATFALDQMLAEILPDASQAAPRAELLGQLLSLAMALDDQETAAAAIQAVTAEPSDGYATWQFDLLGRILDTLDRQGASLRQLTAATDQLQRLFEAARDCLDDEEAPLADRTAAMRILGRGPTGQEDDLETLVELLVPQSPMELQLALVETLGRLRHEEIPGLLLEGWAEQSPVVHNAILDVLLRREGWLNVLLDEIEDRPELATSLGTARRDTLLVHPNEAIRQRVEQLLGKATTKEEIQAALDKFQPVLNMTGDPARGKQVFGDVTCADCHLLQGVGKEVATDLRTLVDKSPGALLTAVIDPNQACEDKFIEYTAVTADGLMISGMLLEETSNSITLADVSGKSHVVLRKDIEELVSNNRSHMPEGLEEKLDLQKMADLFAFIAGAAPERLQIEGNNPRLITPEADGSLLLRAAECEVYSPGIRMGGDYLIWFYKGPEDRVVWSVDVPKAGKYEVWVQWGQIDEYADNPIAIEVEGQDSRIETVFPSTGGWGRFLDEKFGELKLQAGGNRIVLRPTAPAKTEVSDLRSLRLVPVAEPTRASR